ncbi:insulin-like growth factor-binding protein complex acid labile subunit [Tribolium castaneum]|uniref:insulin-like growth factor-binding protein complex acid labile subunit n=1 Tax=Tribolium castaneum TaxID=7070 RepID=UPI0030FE1220
MFVASLCILASLISTSSPYCVEEWDEIYVIHCTNTSLENFIYDFDPFNEKDSQYRRSYAIVITNSQLKRIDFFYLPFSNPSNLMRLSLTNSSIEYINDSAFEDYRFSDLVLSNNKLHSMSFVEKLPTNLNKLYLDGNHFSSVGNVFANLIHLTHLDLSNCRIQNIDPDSFSSLKSLIFISVSNNRLVRGFFVFNFSPIPFFDLSFNKMEHLDFKGDNLHFGELDISHNPLKNIDFLNKIKFGDLKLASTNVSGDFNFLLLNNVYFSLDLNNNKLVNLHSDLFKVETYKGPFRKNINFFNSSISNIDRHAFKNFGYYYDYSPVDNNPPILNLSSNAITELKNYTFEGSFISTLDLSKCLIQNIQIKAFSGLYLTDTLNLSLNRISHLNENVFKNLTLVQTIDLSFNFLKKLNNQLFIDCHSLKFINLSNSRIELIKEWAFAGSDNLLELNLENNFLEKINFRNFSRLEMLNLHNNKLSNLDLSFLCNLSAKNVVMSHNKMRKLLNNSCATVKSPQEMDLSKSSICSIEAKTFRGLFWLEVLTLRDNFIETILPETFTYLKRLKQLDLSANRIAFLSENSFAFGNRLNMLNITFVNANLTGHLFKWLNHVVTLNISNSQVSLLKGCFKGLKYLENFYFHESEVVAVNPGAFQGLDSLKQFNVHSIFRNTKVLQSGTFVGLKYLDHLNLSHLEITVIETQAFEGLTTLLKLCLSRNNLTKIVSGTFVGLDHLKMLDLSRNKISQLEVRAFYGLYSLRELHLNRNNLTTLSLGTFQQFPTLEVLNLRRNNINKILTGTFSNLKFLKTLDLSYNNITKLKMETLITLSNLKKIDLTANHLIQMEHLDLIKSLRHLEFVGLNDNKWKCDNLVSMLIAFQNYSVNWLSTESATFTHENIDGIKCFDICNFFYCVDEEDLTWRN